MTSEGTPKASSKIPKTTVVIGLILLALGYFIGNTIPIGNNFQSNPQYATITKTIGSPDQTTKKISGSVNLEVPSYAKFQGDGSAKINLVEFGDYQCPFCEKFFQYTEPQLMKDYINTAKAKFYFLDFVIVGQDSLTLTQGAWCADEQGKYYEYHDYVYSHQGQENTGWGTSDKVKSFVGNIPGLDVKEFGACLDSKKYASRAQELTQMAQNLGATGTPTLFIGNSEKGYTKITGAQPYSVYMEIVNQYLQ